MISAHYEKSATRLAQIAKLEISLKNANLLLKLRLYTFLILEYNSMFGIRLTQVSSVSLFLWNTASIPFLYTGKWKSNLSTCWSKFEMKAATYLEQTANKYSNIATTTLQSSHENEHPVWLLSLKIIRSVWHGWDWHIYRNSSAVTPLNTRQNYGLNCPNMPILLHTA